MRKNSNLGKVEGINSGQKRFRILFKGIVQGVGFRPFLYRSALKYKLSGSVKNTSQGVILEVEGENINHFLQYILNHLPPLSKMVEYEIKEVPLQYQKSFKIIPSERLDNCELLVSPDIAVCNHCQQEYNNQKDRRHQYAFINCTNCGPRFTIIRDLPYDRPATTMNEFKMCDPCNHEYHNPMDRRYHAQPISCFNCGPSLYFSDSQGRLFPHPLKEALAKLKEGYVVAVKGLGGFHLACKAYSETSVAKLRERKQRDRKPFALMGTIEMIKRNCYLSEKEESMLRSASAPIVLLKKKKESQISTLVAPDQNRLGFMLPYTPVHLLLLNNIKEPLVMTSANYSDEPIIFRNDEIKLKSLADFNLFHNRDIHIFADDTVLEVFENQPYMVRRSRGYVPYPLDLPFSSSQVILGLGPMLKTTFTLIHKNKAFISQYIGNTDSPAAIEAERFALRHFMKIFNLRPDIIAIDKHPEYPNRILLKDFKQADVVEVQHHRAHVASLLLEKGEMEKIIGIAADGTGYGDDQTIWGGEFFVGDYKNLSRFAHLKYLFLPGGDQSVKEPWRFALSILHEVNGKNSRLTRLAERFGQKGSLVLEAIEKKLAGVLTSSCGRLFDGVASILGIGDSNSYDGDLPSRLQAEAEKSKSTSHYYSYRVEEQNDSIILNFIPAIAEMINDSREISTRALIFHRTLAKSFTEIAEMARDKYHLNKVGLTGGVFQNTLLLKLTKSHLSEKGFQVLIHSEIPPNDAGISPGQAFLALGKYLRKG